MSAASAAGVGTHTAARRLVWWLVVPVLALLAVLTLLQYHQRLDEAERELLRSGDERAQELEAIARPAMAHVADLRRLLELHWDAPPDSGPELRQLLRPLPLPGQPARVDGWSLDEAQAGERQRYGQVWWAPLDGREPERRWLDRAAMFLRAARVVHERAPGFEATWFAAAEENASFGYPWVATPRMLAAMGRPTLQALDVPRQEGVASTLADLARQPDDISFWGVPYVGQLNAELVVSHGAVVLVDGTYRGEVSLDFSLASLQALAERWQVAGARVWVVDRRLHVLADAGQPLRPPPGVVIANAQVRAPLAERLPFDAAALDRDLAALPRQPGSTLLQAPGWRLVASVREGSPWLVVQAVPDAVLRAQVLPTLAPNALLALALLAVFVAGQWLIARWFVSPALAVLGYLRRRSTDPAAAPPQLDERWRGWVEAVTDTFEMQQRLQQRERASQAFKSAMVDHAPTAIVTSDGQGRIVDFNPAAEALFGLPREQALGRDLAEVVLPESARRERRRLGSTGAPAMGRHSSGREFPMQWLGFRVQIDGAPFDTAFITDLSVQHDAQLQIERQREALRQSEKLSAMGTLLAGVAHELNNPLAIVMGRASLLEEKALSPGDPQALQDDARRIREAAERCGRIVRTFLNMARQKPPVRSAVQLGDTVRAAADMLGYTLRSHGVRVELALDDELPPVQADPDQLGQVVLNLMVNAQQALEGHAGERVIRLTTGVEAPRAGPGAREPRVWLRVHDNGPGVPAALRERLFEPFFTTKAAGLGTGLGLSVSRGIVREHGGDLVLENSAAGASFRLSLPISGGGAAADAPSATGPAGTETNRRVLVVDDEPEIADLMRAVLEGAGFDVATAESGAVALELLAEARFDAVVSDVRMPDLDGAALWRALRQQHPALAGRLLFVSGDTLSAQAREVLEQTGRPCLDKPFGKADLLAAVVALLER